MELILATACPIKSQDTFGIYKPRKPTKTILYKVVQENLETYLQTVREENPDYEPVPQYVEKEFRKYLDCGILAKGFARAYCSSCGENFLIPFSCKGRCVCPSCNQKRMVETAAYLVDNVIPRIPVRQWVLSVPKRVRYFIYHNKKVSRDVLKIFLRAVETTIRKRSPGAPSTSRSGAVSFCQNFGSILNVHPHYHSIILDGVFYKTENGEVSFAEATELTEQDLTDITAKVQKRILRYLVRHDYLSSSDADGMLQWEHDGGFSINNTVRIEDWDREGLERLIRYCARPPFSVKRLSMPDENTIIYYPQKSFQNSVQAIMMSPEEFIHKLVQLIPKPRSHRQRYWGVLAPHSALRKLVITKAGPSYAVMQQMKEAQSQMNLNNNNSCNEDIDDKPNPAFSRLWAMLMARIYEVFPLICTKCKEPMSIISFITDKENIGKICKHIGEPEVPPSLNPPRAPPDEIIYNYD